MKEAIRRTGLTKQQLIALEQRGLIVAARWKDDRRCYTPDQIALLRLFAEFHRELRLTYDEAMRLVREINGGAAELPAERLHQLRRQLLASGRRQIELAITLESALERRPVAA